MSWVTYFTSWTTENFMCVSLYTQLWDNQAHQIDCKTHLHIFQYKKILIHDYVSEIQQEDPKYFLKMQHKYVED